VTFWFGKAAIVASMIVSPALTISSVVYPAASQFGMSSGLVGTFQSPVVEFANEQATTTMLGLAA
jgi:hypothetical protein